MKQIALLLLLASVALAEQTSNEAQPKDCKTLPKKERKSCEKQQKGAQKAAREAAEYAANHRSLPITDIVGSCISLTNMNLRRDVDYVQIDWLNRQAVIRIAVTGTASNRCEREAQVMISGNFYDQFGTQVGTQFVDILVPGMGSNPFRIVPSICSLGAVVGGTEVCAQTIDTVRVTARSNIN
jgi:hypothetical protein